MSFTVDQIKQLVSKYVTDAATQEAALNELATLPPSVTIDGADVDLERLKRCGFPEVIYAEGKPADLVVKILTQQQKSGQHGFATRVSEEHATAVLTAFPNARHNAIARTLTLAVGDSSTNDESPNLEVAVISAGSCDAAVAQEAIETLRWMKVASSLIEDVGVAGPHRLLKHVPDLQKMKAIVCVAGMEAALPSVLGGHVSCPVIGVPTSVGYGASLQGITAMLSMLTCCASNVVTVNIDAGFRGGYVAGMIATQARNAHSKPSAK